MKKTLFFIARRDFLKSPHEMNVESQRNWTLARFRSDFAKLLRWRELTKLLDHNSVTSGGRRLSPKLYIIFAACLL